MAQDPAAEGKQRALVQRQQTIQRGVVAGQPCFDQGGLGGPPPVLFPRRQQMLLDHHLSPLASEPLLLY